MLSWVNENWAEKWRRFVSREFLQGFRRQHLQPVGGAVALSSLCVCVLPAAFVCCEMYFNWCFWGQISFTLCFMLLLCGRFCCGRCKSCRGLKTTKSSQSFEVLSRPKLSTSVDLKWVFKSTSKLKKPRKICLNLYFFIVSRKFALISFITLGHSWTVNVCCVIFSTIYKTIYTNML